MIILKRLKVLLLGLFWILILALSLILFPILYLIIGNKCEEFYDYITVKTFNN